MSAGRSTFFTAYEIYCHIRLAQQCVEPGDVLPVAA
jgi:hypothetical protein